MRVVTYILKFHDGADLQINVWNWRPTVALIANAGIVPVDQAELLMVNGIGASVTDEQALAISRLLAGRTASMHQGDRLQLDGTIVQGPKDLSLDFSPHADWSQHYAATYEWLVKLQSACARGNGFKVL